MSRSISQIYSEAVAARNSYLQLTELDTGRTASKMSIMNLITYCVSVMIYAYETALDVFQVNIAQLIGSRVNGTPKYYAAMAKKFQFNDGTQNGDELTFDEDAMQIKYKSVDETHRIITQAAYQMSSDGNGITLKVCKDRGGATDDEPAYVQLTANELTAFKKYIDEIKFLGTKITCISIPGDILRINAKVIYDDLYLTEAQAFEAIRNALVNYVKGIGYNGYIYYQGIVDAMQSVEHIVSITGEVDYAKIYRRPYNVGQQAYSDEEVEITNRDVAYSGYLTFIDETDSDKSSTIKIGTGYLAFEPNSTNQN